MSKIFGFIALCLVSGSVAAEGMTKLYFKAEASKRLTKSFCTYDRFLECTEDDEKLCMAQMKFVVVPHCFKKYDGDISENITDDQASKIAGQLRKCVAITYPAFNQVDPEQFSACMRK